jgi:hypothetical protein
MDLSEVCCDDGTMMELIQDYACFYVIMSRRVLQKGSILKIVKNLPIILTD